MTRHSDVPDETLHENSGAMPDRQFSCLAKKIRGAATASGVGVGEAVPDQHRADSLNTGWVKVPVKFSALAVVGSETGVREMLAIAFACLHHFVVAVWSTTRENPDTIEPPESDPRSPVDAICVTRTC
jgi:hypothetical protein